MRETRFTCSVPQALNPLHCEPECASPAWIRMHLKSAEMHCPTKPQPSELRPAGRRQAGHLRLRLRICALQDGQGLQGQPGEKGRPAEVGLPSNG